MRKDYNALNRTQHFVKANGEERKQLLEYLKGKGFRFAEPFSEGDVLNSPFPVAIHTDDKTIGILGGAAIAGAAAASDVILTSKEFYSVFK